MKNASGGRGKEKETFVKVSFSFPRTPILFLQNFLVWVRLFWLLQGFASFAALAGLVDFTSIGSSKNVKSPGKTGAIAYPNRVSKGDYPLWPPEAFFAYTSD